VFEDGQLTDGLGNQVDFKNTIIIMTSNLGARFLEKRGHLGFSAPGRRHPAKVEDMVRGEVKKAFNPEFLNRLDEVILFTSLTDDDLIKIIDLLVEQINVNLVAKQIKIRLNPTPPSTFSRRPAATAATARVRCAARLQKYIEDPLSEALIQGSLPRPGRAGSLPRRHRHLRLLARGQCERGLHHRKIARPAVNAYVEKAADQQAEQQREKASIMRAPAGKPPWYGGPCGPR
jgi:ATP-dependent Clp protease ATP-binding subunit ClpA